MFQKSSKGLSTWEDDSSLGRQMCEGGATSLEGPSVSTSRPPTKDNSQDPLLLLSPRAKKSQSSSIEDREKGGGHAQVEIPGREDDGKVVSKRRV